MNIRRRATAIAMSLVMGLAVSGLDVAEDEIRSTEGTSVEFINYAGPHDRIDTIEQILGVGRLLASVPLDQDGQASVANKYKIIHAVDTSVSVGLDADLLMLLSAAEVDHIDNVRRILAGYLEREYDYSVDDALLLAKFATVYNAVYRGKLAYFQSVYKTIVLDALEDEKVGISTVYREWPGATQLVIPLSDSTFAALDSDVLTEEEVIEELRRQPDRGIPERKEITELKEREVETAQRAIDVEREELATERREIETSRNDVETERTDLTAAREVAVEENDEAQIATIAAREEELDAAEEEIRTEERTIAARESELDSAEAAQSERIERIQSEREEIAGEERALLDQIEPDGATTGISGILTEAAANRTEVFLRIRMTDGIPFGSFVHIRSDLNTVVAESEINSVRNRRFVESEGVLFAVAGEIAENRSVRLIAIDSETLVLLATSSVEANPSSWIELEESGTLLAVISQDDEWHLGRLDQNLELIRASNIPVTPTTLVRVAETLIYLQDADENIVGLSATDLSLARVVE